MRSLLWVIAAVGALLGGAEGSVGLLFADSAPQQAASAAVAVMLAVVPYVLARAFDELRYPRSGRPTA